MRDAVTIRYRCRHQSDLRCYDIPYDHWDSSGGGKALVAVAARGFCVLHDGGYSPFFGVCESSGAGGKSNHIFVRAS
jgi:hypothetical protein